MNNANFILLVCRKFSGEASNAELQELDLFLSTHPEFLQQYKLLSQHWEQHENPNQVFVEEALQKTLHQLHLPVNNIYKTPVKIKSRSIFLPVMAVAASAAVIVVMALFFTKQSKKADLPVPLATFEKKQNSKGIKSTIQLADGSKVWLNADSKIQYPPTFDGNTREIYLDGEAFFEVAKNPKKPFIIHLANGTVRVLGTSFNIRAYNNEKVVETSVATGRVAFIPKYKNEAKKQDTLFITPNNKVSYIYNVEKIKVAPTVAKDDIAWTEGKMIFKAMSLLNIATELERNFGKKVVFTDDAAKQYILTGSFKNNTLEEVMYYLSKTKGFYYKITNTELMIAANAAAL